MSRVMGLRGYRAARTEQAPGSQVLGTISSVPPPDSSPVKRRSYWNERYRREPSRYGDEPSEFVSRVAGPLAVGSVLDVACGQGRNAVWLAQRGHRVTAIDLSAVAIAQARELASGRGVDVDFQVADFRTWEPPADGYDLVVLSYLQLPPVDREAAHRRAVAALAPGGRLLLVAHHRDNIEHGVGGPDNPDVLYEEEILAADFATLDVERNERVLREVDRDDLKGEAIDVLFVGRLAGTE